MDEKQLVANHVLYEQNAVVEELMKADCGLIDSIRNLDDTDILEWWLVTHWLAELLIENGESVLSEYGNNWWGRTCSGQAIYMDSVIADICASLS